MEGAGDVRTPHFVLGCRVGESREGRGDDPRHGASELRSYDGFAGYLALYDAESSRARAVILWDSKEAGEAAEETLAERRAGMASSIGLTIESADLYEAVVVELEGARV